MSTPSPIRQARAALGSNPVNTNLRARVDLTIMLPAPLPGRAVAIPLHTAVVDAASLAATAASAASPGPASVVGGIVGTMVVAAALPSPVDVMAGGVGQTISVQGLEPLDYSWTKRPLGKPDELSVEIYHDALPMDFRLIKGAQIHGWLYTHGQPGMCLKGDAGHFAGVVARISRSRHAGRMTLECRDFTWLLAQKKIGANDVRSICFGGGAVGVFAALLRLVPGGERWAIEADSVVLASVEKAFIAALGFSDVTWQQAATHAFNPPKLTSLVLGGAKEIKVWDAIHRFCAFLGVVPNVVFGRKGIALQIVDTGSFASSFSRLTHRTITDGESILSLNEERSLEAGVRYDVVKVISPDPETGRMLSAEYGRGGKNGASQRTTTLVTYGVNNQSVLYELARKAHASINEGEYKIEIVTGVPWSDGGGPDTRAAATKSFQDFTIGGNSDLISLDPDEPIEIIFKGFDELTGGSPAEIMVQRGFPAAAVAAVAAAAAQLRPGALLQVKEVSHAFNGADDGGYRCSIRAQTFLDDGDLSIPQVDPVALIEDRVTALDATQEVA